MQVRARFTRLLAVAASTAVTSSVQAGNDDELFVGNDAAMAGGAIAAMVADSSATWYNPAGLGAVARDQIDVSGTAYTLRFYSAAGFLRSVSGPSDDASVTEFLSIPSQVAFVRRLAPGTSIGLGYFVPQAGNLLLREALAVNEGGVSSSWQFTLRLTRVQHTAAIALGTTLSRGVRVGLSLVGTYEDATESISIAMLSTAAGVPIKFQSDTVLGTFTRAGMELVTGFQFELSPKFRLALTARSARVLLHQRSEYTQAYGSARASAEGASILAFMAQPSHGRTGFDVVRAGRAGVGLAYLPRPGDWVSVELDVQPGVRAESAAVDRRPVVNARLGGYHRMSELVALGAGLFTDRAPDRGSGDLVNGHGDFYGATLGIELSNEHRLARGERAQSLVLSSTFALRYAFSNGTLNGLLVNPDPAVAEYGASPGRLVVHELGLYVGGGLGF
jgi:hypothetical protein